MIQSLYSSAAPDPVSFWVHNLDPVIFDLWGPLAVRWYGLAYLLGFLCGYLLLLHLAGKGDRVLRSADLSSLILHIAIYGVLLGGRLGYVLLYALSDFLKDPLFLFRVWEGGMSSHGGMIGVILVTLWTARKKKISFLELTDRLALVAPVGIFFGRLANFINGELWGRPAGVRWAVVFPRAGDLLPRHPSQLYEALGEGLFLFLALWFLFRTEKGKQKGLLSAAFLILYGCARILCEFFREPDSTVYLDFFTKGQVYSFVMILAGSALLLRNSLFRSGEKR